MTDEELDAAHDAGRHRALYAEARRARAREAELEECLDERREQAKEWAVRESELTEKLDEREHDMHMRIRAGYDTTVADSWRAKVDELAAHAERLRENLETALRCMGDAKDGAFANGNTDPNGVIDEGETLTADFMARAHQALASTPAQSLAAVRAEVWEEAATIVEDTDVVTFNDYYRSDDGSTTLRNAAEALRKRARGEG